MRRHGTRTTGATRCEGYLLILYIPASVDYILGRKAPRVRRGHESPTRRVRLLGVIDPPENPELAQLFKVRSNQSGCWLGDIRNAARIDLFRLACYLCSPSG